MSPAKSLLSPPTLAVILDKLSIIGSAYTPFLTTAVATQSVLFNTEGKDSAVAR